MEEEFSLVWRDLNVGLNPQIQQYLAIVKPFVNSLQSMGIFGQEPPERQAVFEKHLNSASLLKESSVGVPGATKVCFINRKCLEFPWHRLERTFNQASLPNQ